MYQKQGQAAEKAHCFCSALFHDIRSLRNGDNLWHNICLADAIRFAHERRSVCRGFSVGYGTQGKQCRDQQRQRDGKHNQRIGDKACNQIPHKADGCRSDGIGQLRGNVRHMIALGAGRGHDGGIGNGRAVIAADRTGHTGGNTDHAQRIAEGEHA